MPWQFRKSFRLGPFRINLGKSGWGWSVGGKGVRTGRSSRGRPYTSVSLPGTGIRWYSNRLGPKGCFGWMLVVVVLLIVLATSGALLTWGCLGPGGRAAAVFEGER